MKIMHKNLRDGEIRLKAENLDDLWCLSGIIESGDIISGRTLRKIKLGGEEDRKSSAFKKELFLKIKAESIEFHKYSDILRISGTVIEGTDDVSNGSYHTFSVEPGSTITITKGQWIKPHLDKIEMSSVSLPKIAVCIFDREEAFFYLIRMQGYEKLLEMKGDIEKKYDSGSRGKAKGSFYSEIIDALKEYDKRYALEKIIIASPAFWKEYLMKEVTDPELKKKLVPATVSSVDKTSIEELMKRQELESVLKEDRVSKEEKAVSELFFEIAKDGLSEYGFNQVSGAVNSGAAEKILVTDEFIKKARQEGKYPELERLMRLSESIKASIIIISSENEPGKRLDGIGGIAAKLRYKIN
ncbi:MAG: mRNA surveillance protein pelota [Candidatus Woesearchaeota archaeon]|nr:mRNA surveillance protein pelota [Candidatus Woesearchaeota archaeon]